MEHIKDIVQGASAPQIEIGDYFDGEGFLCCGKCHTRKQLDFPVPKKVSVTCVWRLPVLCACQKEARNTEEAEKEHRKFEQRMEALRRDGITDPAYQQYTFDRDDRKNVKISDICRQYVENWEKMQAENIGILFFGDVGTGKSFLACAIANALLEKLVSVSVTNFPRLLNSLQGADRENRQRQIDRLQQYALLVIDDLGVERDTSFSVEQVYNVIDTRARSCKPLIITTNLSLQDLRNPPTLGQKRIYDRVLEMCPMHLKMTGDSRRIGNSDERKAAARRIFGK